MLDELNLTKRQQHVLWATIRHYISTAEPVSSKVITEGYNFRVSPATIRNAMGLLEKSGLLYQPHTSAGRVPSDSGYRIYVDKLITPDEAFGQQVEQRLTQELNWDSWSFEALFRSAAHILSTLSGYVALITMPQNSATRLRHLQLLPVNAQQVMLIIVTDAYQTQSVLVDLPQTGVAEEFSERELQILSNFLNSQLKGRSLSEIANLDWQELDRELKQYADLLQLIVTELSRRNQPHASTDIMVRGVSEVLRQPEFSHLQQVQMLLHLLEDEQDQLLPFMLELPDDTTARRVTIRIGAENQLEPLNTCTLITANYRQGDLPVGSVGIIGPTRMLYENAIALVESAADYLTDALTPASP